MGDHVYREAVEICHPLEDDRVVGTKGALGGYQMNVHGVLTPDTGLLPV